MNSWIIARKACGVIRLALDGYLTFDYGTLFAIIELQVNSITPLWRKGSKETVGL